MAGHKMTNVPTLGADPQAEDSGSVFTHWLKTLENQFGAQDAVPTAETKLSVLQTKVDHHVYRSIARCTTYDAAVEELKRLYIKKRSVVYNRHLLPTRRQQPTESIDRFAQELRHLLADSTQEVQTHEQVQDDLVRDAFVSGISSTNLRLRLLETADLTFAEALRLANVYTEAREQSNAYDHAPVVAGTSQLARPERATAEDTGAGSTTAQPLAAPEVDSDSGLAAATAARPRPDRNATCYFCGNRQHPRSACPAREAICHLCSTKGHFAIVCKKAAWGTRAHATLNGLIAEPTDRAQSGAPHPALMSGPPPRGPLAARTSLVRYIGPPKQMAQTRPAAEQPTLTGVRTPSSNKQKVPALKAPPVVQHTLHVTRAPSDGSSDERLALAPARESTIDCDLSHVTRAPSDGSSYELHALAPERPTMRLARGPSGGSSNDRKTAAGVGSTREARSSRSDGAIPSIALSGLCPPNIPTGRTRSACNPLMVKLPKSRLSAHLHSFIPLFSRLWNKLPHSLQSHSTLQVFKTAVHHHLLSSPIQNLDLFYPR
uniref:uncharacterized protein n=1 Tax=Myxine glutinosa TaxID=7769 RepID=UPI00358EF48E